VTAGELKLAVKRILGSSSGGASRADAYISEEGKERV
jgi:hypothetical protein